MSLTFDEVKGSGKSTDDLDGNVSFVEQYQVYDSAFVPITAAAIRTGLAAIDRKVGRLYPDSNSVLVKRDLNPEDTSHVKWRVTLSYATQQTNSDPNTEQDDPVNQPAVVRFGSVEKMEVAEFAYDDDDPPGAPSIPILNPAFDPFDPPVTDAKTNLLIIIDKNYSSFDPLNITRFKNTTNKNKMSIGGISGIDPKKLIMRDLAIEPGWKQDGTTYDMVHFEIELTDKTVTLQLANLGLSFLADDDSDYTTKTRIRYSDINPDIAAGSEKDTEVPDPQLLTTTGGLYYPGGAGDKYSSFQRKYPADWAPLDLPRLRDGTK